MIKFKVGDRVKVSNWYDSDEVGIVTNIEYGRYLVEYEDGDYIYAETVNMLLAPGLAPNFKGVYVVSYGAYDGGGVLGVYATLKDAEAAMTVLALHQNAEDEQDAREYPHPHYQPRPYLPFQDNEGYLIFKGGRGNSLYIDLIELGAPCMWSWDRDQAVKHG